MSDFYTSELLVSIKNAKHNQEALINKKRYVEMAITHWKKERDDSQVAFFNCALNLINKYLK
ncbi:hypothetical protein VCSRO111_0632 [Vibrio cholerae]|nr:hypothetical protein VCSRO111_0632 [Vibrio cholerae]